MHSGALTFLKLRKVRAEYLSIYIRSYCCTGCYNKIFLLKFENDTQAIARIPSSIVGNVELSTAYRHARVDIALFPARDGAN